MINEIERLKSAVGGSPELRKGLDEANDTNGIVAFANSKGYNFTVGEFEQWTKQKASTSQLSDADLQAVSGGTAGAGTSKNSRARQMYLWMLGVHPDY